VHPRFQLSIRGSPQHVSIARAGRYIKMLRFDSPYANTTVLQAAGPNRFPGSFVLACKAKKPFDDAA